MDSLIDYQFVRAVQPLTTQEQAAQAEETSALLPPFSANCLYQYLVGSNGSFLRVAREGMEVCLPLAHPTSNITLRGLTALTSYVQLDFPPVPTALMRQMLHLSRAACNKQGSNIEILFYLVWHKFRTEWELMVPVQKQLATSVEPRFEDESTLQAYQAAVIEIHSHHQLPAFFSSTDDQDEQGLRFYGVLGRIFDQAEISLRFGCYSQFFPLPASTVLELNNELADTYFRQSDHYHQ